VNQEDSEQNEVDGMKKGADSTGKVIVKERLLICNDEDTDRIARLQQCDTIRYERRVKRGLKS